MVILKVISMTTYTHLSGFVHDFSLFLVMKLTQEGTKGDIYFLGDKEYISVNHGGNGFMMLPNLREEPYPDGDRNAFVEKAMNDSKCLGFVPTSEIIEKELRNLKMEPYLNVGNIGLYM